jgi:hypothetical protein
LIDGELKVAWHRADRDVLVLAEADEQRQDEIGRRQLGLADHVAEPRVKAETAKASVRKHAVLGA